MKHRCLAVIFMMLFWIHSKADTLRVFTMGEFFSAVRTYHPVAKQSMLKARFGEASLLSSRGAFDPKIQTGFQDKFYDSKSYYELFRGELSVPTWYGLELKGGAEQNRGIYLDPQNTVPDNGLLYAGISANLGKGLRIDERRAALKQAKIYRDLTLSEQRSVMNALVYQAGSAYWEWYEAYRNLQVYEEAVEIASIRLEAVRQSALLGDRPFVDTLEAGIQLQERMLGLMQARVDYTNKTLGLEVFLWTDQDHPYGLPEFTVPEAFTGLRRDRAILQPFSDSLNLVLQQHPDLMMPAYELESLEIEKLWKREQLKPEINLQYYPLFEPTRRDGMLYDNYKWGLNLSMPVLLRKERGALRMTEIRLQDAGLKLNNKKLEIENRTRSWINEYVATGNQLNLYERTVEEYYNLLEAERRIFDAGESSLFMINAREMSYISARIKLIGLQVKNGKALLAAYWSGGIAGELIVP